MTRFRPLPWDTDFFGHRIAIASERTFTEEGFLEMLEAARNAGTECLYLLVDTRDSAMVLLAEESGSRLTGIRVTLVQRLDGQRQSDPEKLASIRSALEHEATTLVQLSRGCFTDTRFFRDPHFTEAQCKALYATWIQKSCEGWADIVLVAEREDAPVSFISCHSEPEGMGRIGLVCVHRVARGLGYGRLLVNAALDWFGDHGANQVSVVTQGSNIPALQLYQKCGFAISSIDLWFHKWFE